MHLPALSREERSFIPLRTIAGISKYIRISEQR
jgi:hypothetical protein